MTNQEARQVVAKLTTYEVIQIWQAFPDVPRPSMRQFAACVQKVRKVLIDVLTRGEPDAKTTV